MGQCFINNMDDNQEQFGSNPQELFDSEENKKKFAVKVTRDDD